MRPMVDAAKADGNSGTTPFTFTVTRNAATAVPVSVDFPTASGTAIGNTSCTGSATGSPDYLSKNGTLTFPAGTTTQTQRTEDLACGDTALELDEIFTVNLSKAPNATITKGTGTGTIQNDDAKPLLSIDDVGKAEGNSGTTTFTFTVPLTGAFFFNDTATTEIYTLSLHDAPPISGSATGSPDYLSKNGTLTFPAGTTTQTQ